MGVRECDQCGTQRLGFGGSPAQHSGFRAAVETRKRQLDAGLLPEAEFLKQCQLPSQGSIVAGSHREGWMMPRSFMNNEAKWFPEGTLAELPQIEADRDSFDILGWALEPGDCVFFHMLTLHHAYGVPGSNRRRAFSLRFLGDDAVHAPRPWRTSPQFDGLDDELPAGAPMDHPLFPVLRVRG